MADLIAAELYTLVVSLKERDDGISVTTLRQLGRVYDLLEPYADLQVPAGSATYTDHTGTRSTGLRYRTRSFSTGTRRSRPPRKP
jgi:hypothetical protein